MPPATRNRDWPQVPASSPAPLTPLAAASSLTVTATDQAGNTTVASVTYEVKATPQGTSALIDALVNAGLIPAQTAATLLDTLARALSAYSSDPNLGVNMMNTFQNQINAALNSGKIDAATAALLNTAANYIVTNN